MNVVSAFIQMPSLVLGLSLGKKREKKKAWSFPHSIILISH
jgi:hypothetical protein